MSAGVLFGLAALGLLLWNRARAQRVELETASLAEWTVDDDGPAKRMEQIIGWCESASAARIDSLLTQYPEWSDAILANIACRTVTPGMTTDQLIAAWGPPTAVQPSRDRFRPDERWFYGSSVTVFVWGGKVKSTHQF